MPKLTQLLASVAVLAMVSGAAMAEDAKTAAPADATQAETAAKPRPDLTADTVVATVNGQDITLGMMQTVRDGLPAQYKSLADDKLFNGILEQLIQQTALAQLEEKRITQRDKIALEVQKRAYLSGAMLNYTADKAVTDEAVQQEYDAKYAKAEPTKEYHAAHIIVKTKEEAEKIKAEIDGGADFAEEAKKNSFDGTAANGGDLGWFKLDAMVKPFADAVAGMKDGEIVGPVQTQYGWHVIKLIGTKLVDAPKLADVRDELEGDIRQAAVEKRVKDVVDGAKIEKMTDGIDPSILKDQSILGSN
ncbi:peptidylprolyl isomerase [Thioclava marina]|uniref:Parvulin-like PPIase n=1 Tax=Thioclava marina TaxID=1915077 RepID=A0ABX3MR63_9RHOB|nr:MULTISPECIES: peptidylprolyl isomerase [Thioclava]MBD3803373.1 peptidylprolyl isomerase [Thioclava sp.]OOY14031.1 peptidylprolyl isomerase [Thioclava marina]